MSKCSAMRKRQRRRAASRTTSAASHRGGHFIECPRRLVEQVPARNLRNCLFLENVREHRVVAANIRDLPDDAVPILLRTPDLTMMAWVSQGALEELGSERGDCFQQDAKEMIAKVREVFADLRLLSQEEWERQIKLQVDPADALARWLRAAEICEELLVDRQNPSQRRDCLAVCAAWATVPAEMVWHVAAPRVLSQAQVLDIIRKLSGPDYCD